MLVNSPDNRPHGGSTWLKLVEGYGAGLIVEATNTVGLLHIVHADLGFNFKTFAAATISVFPAIMASGATFATIEGSVRNGTHKYPVSDLLRSSFISLGTGFFASQALPGWEGVMAGLAAASPTAISTYEKARTRFR